MKGRVTVYSITGCPYCIKAKKKLTELKLDFVDINLDVLPARRKEMQELTARRTVPQIFFNSRHIGGFSELDALSSAELEDLIKMVTENEAPENTPSPPQDHEENDADGYGSSGFICEQDEYAELVKQIKESGVIKDHGSFLWQYKNTFKGKEVISWLVDTKQVDRERAVVMAQTLMDKHFCHAAKKDTELFNDDDTLYRLLQDDESNALNADVSSDCEPRPAAEVGESLRKLILHLYAKYLSEDGKGVDYAGMKASKEFDAYVRHSGELKRVKLENTKREEKLSFFINVYNALVIHANVVNGPPVTMWQRYKFFNVVGYVIAGHVYSLHDIESGVLRANRKAVASLFRPFPKHDPRLVVAFSEPEPMIHFALVCGAKSCPPIKTYTPDGIDDQLRLAGEAFLEGDDGCDVDMTKHEIKLSMIFKWYREDFGNNKTEVVQWVHDHMGESDKKRNIAELLKQGNIKVSHMSYNWNLNSK